jgi:hypothetical protein
MFLLGLVGDVRIHRVSIAIQRAWFGLCGPICIQRCGLIIVPPAVTVVPATPITAVIIVTAAIHIRIPIIRPAAVVDSHVSCSLRSGGRDRALTGEKKHSEQYQLQQTVPGVKPLRRRIGTAYPTTRFTVSHLHILDKGPSHVQKQNTQGVDITRQTLYRHVAPDGTSRKGGLTVMKEQRCGTAS